MKYPFEYEKDEYTKDLTANISKITTEYIYKRAELIESLIAAYIKHNETSINDICLVEIESGDRLKRIIYPDLKNKHDFEKVTK